MRRWIRNTRFAQRVGMMVLLLGALLCACHRGSDEDEIRDAITQAAAAAGKADAGGSVAALTDDFDGNDGSLARKDLANLVRLVRLRGQRLDVLLGPVRFDRRGDRFVARFDVTLGAASGLLPDSAGLYHVSTAWRREGRRWKCFQAHW